MRVYIVAAYPTVRAGLAALVREQPEWSIVGEGTPDAPLRPTTPTARADALPRASETTADVVLVDLDGVGDAEAFVAALEPLRARGVVALTMPARQHPRSRNGVSEQATLHTVGEFVRAAEEQSLAIGTLLRDATTDEIVAAIRGVASGLFILDRRLASDLLSSTERVAAPASERLTTNEESLTARELEVLQLLAQGLPNKTIATRLHISEHTAKFHVSAIMMKLGAASRTEAVTRGARLGLLIL